MSHPIVIIQARMGSTRLPGKVLLPLVNKSMLWHIVQRCRAVDGIAEVVIATTTRPQDQPILDVCATEGIACFEGSDQDVLSRYYQAAVSFQADPVIRITGDCPCSDPGLIEAVVAMHRSARFDLVGAATGAGAHGLDGWHFPDGLDVECSSFGCLERLWSEAQAPHDREHVSTYALRHPDRFRIGRMYAPADYGHHRWTVDHWEDFMLVRAIYDALWRPECHFTMQEVLGYLEAHPEVYALNRRWVGQEGYAALLDASR